MTLSYISVYILLPPPLILICLLLVPLPKFAQSVLLKGIKSVLFVRVLSHLALCHVMLAASAYSLGTTARQVGLLRSQLEDKGQVTTPAARMEKLAKIWRAERNIWIAFVTFLAWAILYRLYHIFTEFAEQREQRGGQSPSGGEDLKAEASAPPEEVDPVDVSERKKDK